MCKAKDTIILGNMSAPLSGWNKAIYDAEQKIIKAKNRLAQLKAALGLFKERRDVGEPFPCETSESTSEVLSQK